MTLKEKDDMIKLIFNNNISSRIINESKNPSDDGMNLIKNHLCREYY